MALNKIVSFAIVLPLASCSEVSLSPTSTETTHYVQVAALAERDLNERTADEARNIPGFAGWYIAEDGSAVVMLKDEAQARAARELVQKELSETGHFNTEIRTERALYDFLELFGWFAQVDGEVLRMAGFVYADINERRNNLTIGVTDSLTAGLVRRVLISRGVPGEVLAFEIISLPDLHEDITDQVRPVPGGVYLGVDDPYTGGCTVAFNAGGDATHFVTASHCTPTIFGITSNDSTVKFWQRFNTISTDLMGSEVLDPAPYVYSGCSNSGGCRRSDAALLQYSGSPDVVSRDFGRIARTMSRGYGSGSKTINAGDPRIGIAGEVAYPSAGDWVDKMGVGSGWTWGQISNSCVTVNNNLGYTLTCQYKVQYAGCIGGDSGAPVFRNTGTMWLLLGLHWGGSTGSCYFSPMGGIKAEIGPFATY